MVGMEEIINEHCVMKRILIRLLLSLCVVALVSCSAKTSRLVSSGLWENWEAYDQLVQVDYPDAVPIILIHGWNGGEFSWPGPHALIAMETQLHRDIFFFNYRTGVIANRYPPIELLEEQLTTYLKQYSQVDIVAHSMGGLLLRQYLSEHNDNPVRRILLLSTPNFGSNIAGLLVDIGDIGYTGNIQASELLPGSDFLWQLNSLEGVELQGKSVLNVYARAQHELLKGDLVVPASHAWLPWVPNAEVNGDHHLGRRITEAWAMDFLTSGQLPTLAPAPSGRELWLRFQPAGRSEPLKITQPSIRRFDQAHVFKDKPFGLCCENRSGLHPLGGTSLILKDVVPGDVVRLFLRNGTRGALELHMGNLLKKDNRPVQLIVLHPG